MRLFHRATNSVTPETTDETTPAPGRYDPKETWWLQSDPRALEALVDCREFSTVKPDYYWELGGVHAIMWAVTPCTLHTMRYYPEEWGALVAAADAAGLDLRDAASWERLPRHYGH